MLEQRKLDSSVRSNDEPERLSAHTVIGYSAASLKPVDRLEQPCPRSKEIVLARAAVGGDRGGAEFRRVAVSQQACAAAAVDGKNRRPGLCAVSAQPESAEIHLSVARRNRSRSEADLAIHRSACLPIKSVCARRERQSQSSESRAASTLNIFLPAKRP